MGSDRAQHHLKLPALCTFSIFNKPEHVKSTTQWRVRLLLPLILRVSLRGYFTKILSVFESLAPRQRLFIYSEGIHLAYLLLAGLIQVTLLLPWLGCK